MHTMYILLLYRVKVAVRWCGVVLMGCSGCMLCRTDVIKIYCSFFKVFVAFYNKVCYTIRVIRNDKYRKVVIIMVVSDIYKISLDAQPVSIFDSVKNDSIFDGVIKNIPECYLENDVKRIFTAGDVLVLVIE